MRGLTACARKCSRSAQTLPKALNKAAYHLLHMPAPLQTVFGTGFVKLYHQMHTSMSGSNTACSIQDSIKETSHKAHAVSAGIGLRCCIQSTAWMSLHCDCRSSANLCRPHTQLCSPKNCVLYGDTSAASCNLMKHPEDNKQVNLRTAKQKNQKCLFPELFMQTATYTSTFGACTKCSFAHA